MSAVFQLVRWIPIGTASAMLNRSPKVINQARARGMLGSAVDQKRSDGTGRPMLFALDEVEHLVRIMQRCRVGLEVACRIKVALDKGPLL